MVAKNPKRLGVGATATHTAKDAVAEADWTKTGKKKILSIGKIHTHADEDEVEPNINDHGSSSDEEEGRTSAVKERKRKVPNHSFNEAHGITTAADAPKSKKKKKGKKERNATADPVDTLNVINKEATNVANHVAEIEDGERKKHKRKKSRSRQKNIRKDNRSESDRPSYLNVGNSGYAGRPLTKATKEKMGLTDEPDEGSLAKCSSIKEEGRQSDTNDMNNEGNDAAVTPSVGQGTTELSKIGDCIVGDIVVGSKGSINTDGTKKKSKPKRKFKNC